MAANAVTIAIGSICKPQIRSPDSSPEEVTICVMQHVRRSQVMSLLVAAETGRSAYWCSLDIFICQWSFLYLSYYIFNKIVYEDYFHYIHALLNGEENSCQPAVENCLPSNAARPILVFIWDELLENTAVFPDCIWMCDHIT